MTDPAEDDDIDLALDNLYDEIAALEGDIDYQFTLSTSEFRALLAIVRMMHVHIPMNTAERQHALEHLFKLLCEIEQGTQTAAERFLH